MKKRFLVLFLTVLLLALASCTGVDTTSQASNEETTSLETTDTVVEEDEITLKFGDEIYQLVIDDTQASVLDIIEASDIHLVYSTSEYGAMISEIGDYKSDAFHWIGFTKNDEFAMEGIGSISYETGDVFEFTQNLSDWELTLELVFESKDETYAHFSTGTYEVSILLSEISETLFVGETYTVTGTPLSETNSTIMMSVTTVTAQSYTVISDFTDLYTIQLDDIIFLEFTVSEYTGSSAWGYELFAEDINSLSSKDLFPNMPYPSQSDYIFYSMPDGLILEVGKTYIGKFTYQINSPSTIPQITLIVNGDQVEVFEVIE